MLVDAVKRAGIKHFVWLCAVAVHPAPSARAAPVSTLCESDVPHLVAKYEGAVPPSRALLTAVRPQSRRNSRRPVFHTPCTSTRSIVRTCPDLA